MTRPSLVLVWSVMTDPTPTEPWPPPTADLDPIVDWCGDWPFSHGERGDLDPDNSEACLCGRYELYLECPDDTFFAGLTLHADGHLNDGWSE